MKNLRYVFFIFFFILQGTAIAQDFVPSENFPLPGINLAGAGFAGNVIPGKNGQHYLYPSSDDVNTYSDFGMEIIRLSFLWERLQPSLGGRLNSEQLNLIDIVVNSAAKKNTYVILDVHNYAKYRGHLIGSTEVPVSAFTKMWQQLAIAYKDHPNVLFGLMNEPHAHKAKAWANIAQEAITAIRETGAQQAILVPGTNWSSSYKWLKRDGWFSNGDALKNLNDPLNNLIFEAHIYFDKNSSGTSPDCVSESIGVKRIAPFTKWLKENKFKGLLGEFGASNDPVCVKALDNTLNNMRENKDVWFGWTYWAASVRFGDYMFNIYPPDTDKYPQAKVIKSYIESQKH